MPVLRSTVGLTGSSAALALQFELQPIADAVDVIQRVWVDGPRVVALLHQDRHVLHDGPERLRIA